MQEERIKNQLYYQIKFLSNSCRLYDEGNQEEALRIAVVLENLIGQRKSAISIVRHLGLGDIRLYSSTGGVKNNGANPQPTGGARGSGVEERDHILRIRGMQIALGGDLKINCYGDLIDNIDRISLYFGLGVLAVGTKVSESSYSPYLGDLDKDSSSRLVTIRDWLDEIVLITKRKFYVTREELIAVARNQDGGGHVAPRLTGHKLKDAYRELSKDAAVGYFFENKFVNFIGSDQHRFGKKKVPVKGVHWVALRQMAHEVLSSPGVVAIRRGTEPSSLFNG